MFHKCDNVPNTWNHAIRVIITILRDQSFDLRVFSRCIYTNNCLFIYFPTAKEKHVIYPNNCDVVHFTTWIEGAKWHRSSFLLDQLKGLPYVSPSCERKGERLQVYIMTKLVPQTKGKIEEKQKLLADLEGNCKLNCLDCFFTATA